jgi:hypothetical protein
MGGLGRDFGGCSACPLGKGDKPCGTSDAGVLRAKSSLLMGWFRRSSPEGSQLACFLRPNFRRGLARPVKVLTSGGCERLAVVGYLCA